MTDDLREPLKLWAIALVDALLFVGVFALGCWYGTVL